MKIKNKVLFILVICFLANTTYAFAEKSDSIKEEIESNKNEIENLEDKKSNINNKIENEQGELSELEEKISLKENDIYNIQLQISEYQLKIDTIQNEINKLENSINESKTQVEMKEKSLVYLKEEQDKIEALLDSRVRSIYKLDLTKQYIYVLIKSKNIFEVFQKLDSISKLIRFDKELVQKSKENQATISKEINDIEEKIKEQQESRIAIAEKQNELFMEQDKVIAIQNEEKSKKRELLELQDKKQNSIASLEDNKDDINSEIAAIESHNAELEAELDRIFNEVSNNTGNNDKVENLPSESGFLRPVSGRITSHFGYRTNPVTGEYKLHKGIDYAGNYGDGIKASKSGVVEYSGWISGYGNTIILGHGNGVQTLYPHAQDLYVNYGETVSQGDVIASVGSTGNSTGPHLHFEIRINGEAVNPINYIPN